MIQRLSSSSGIAIVLVILGLTLGADNSAAGKKKKKKNADNAAPSVTKVIKKVDRQILSYSPKKARTLLEPVMEEKDPRVDEAMGRILILEKNYNKAATKLLAASKTSKDPYVFVDLGDSYAYAKDQANAQSSYQRAVQKAEAKLARKADNSEALFALGTAQQRLKQYDQAVVRLEQARGAEPENERICFELGLTQMLRGDNQAAFDQLSNAVQLNSSYAYAYYYRALAADKIGRKDILVNDLDRFLFLAPDAPEAAKASRILQASRG